MALPVHEFIVGVSEQALGWFLLCLGLVVQDVLVWPAIPPSYYAEYKKEIEGGVSLASWMPHSMKQAKRSPTLTMSSKKLFESTLLLQCKTHYCADVTN